MKVWKVILAALVIFGAGVVTGSLSFQLDLFESSRSHSKNPGASRSRQRPEFIDRLDKELGLSIDQRARIEQILKESHERMRKLWESVSPKTDEEFKRVRTLILAELTAEQAEIYKEVFQSFGSKRRRGDGNRNGNEFKKPETPNKPKTSDE